MSAIVFLVFFVLCFLTSLAYVVGHFILHLRILKVAGVYESLGRPAPMALGTLGVYRSLWRRTREPQSGQMRALQPWSLALWVLWLTGNLAFVGMAAAFVAMWQR